MAKRHFKNWLDAFLDYSSIGEAPRHVYFWVGVSTIAGALRRKVWIDEVNFRWFPNFYVVIVAPPGIVSKSTTAGIGMGLLRAVPGIRFGPEIVTWQALATSFVNAAETFEYQGLHHTQSALTIESSEFGNLLNPQDKEMVDILVTLWDGKGIKKETKHSGNDEIINPWINLIACTTPAWIAGSFPEYLVGGGLTSRMVFVYAEAKTKYVAYLHKVVKREDHEVIKAKLIADLEHIAINCVGEYRLTPEAEDWGAAWYEAHYKGERPKNLDDERFGGYWARKQTHVHKLAMVLAVSERDEPIITLEDLKTAYTMVSDLEPDMALVFSKIGKTDESYHADRLVAFIQRHGQIPFSEVFKFAHSQFPSAREFEDIFQGLIKAGFVRVVNDKGVPTVVAASAK